MLTTNQERKYTNIMIGIYAIYFNDKDCASEDNIIYIGQSKDIFRRMRQHISSKNIEDYPLIDRLYSYCNSDENYIGYLSWKIIEETNEQSLDEKEQFYISKYKSQLLNIENTPKRTDIYNNLKDFIDNSTYGTFGELTDRCIISHIQKRLSEGKEFPFRLCNSRDMLGEWYEDWYEIISSNLNQTEFNCIHSTYYPGSGSEKETTIIKLDKGDYTKC